MSSTYKALVTTASKYADAKTVEGAIARQLQAGMTPDSFSPADLKAIMVRITTALKLYVPEAAKKAELIAALQALS
jgi:hypothetical protein